MTIACIGCNWFDEEEIITPDYRYKVPWCTLQDIGFTTLPSECKFRNMDLEHICEKCNHGCQNGQPCHKNVVGEYHSGGKLLEICSAFKMAVTSKSLDL